MVALFFGLKHETLKMTVFQLSCISLIQCQCEYTCDPCYLVVARQEHCIEYVVISMGRIRKKEQMFCVSELRSVILGTTAERPKGISFSSAQEHKLFPDLSFRWISPT